MAVSSLAYDLSMYAPKPDRQKKPGRQRLKMVKRKPRAFTPRVVAAFGLVVCMISLIVYNQALLNEVSGDISRLNRELAIMENEAMRYASLLESTVSMRAVAQQAEDELGMARLDQFQIKYVYLYDQDQVILSGGEDKNESAGLLSLIRSLFKGAKG